MGHLPYILAMSTIAASAFGWRALAPLPDKEGFAGAFAGVSNGVLLVAGGAGISRSKAVGGWQQGLV